MKIKDIEYNKNELYEEMRYNRRTLGKPISISNGKTSNSKRQMGSISILGLMSSLGYFDNARKGNDKLVDIINTMLDNAKSKTSRGEIKL